MKQMFNLSVAVMYAGDPIMYLVSKDYECKDITSVTATFVAVELARLLPSIKFECVKAERDEHGVMNTCEFLAEPDEEVAPNAHLLAIWQRA